jgi:hypothetical protein
MMTSSSSISNLTRPSFAQAPSGRCIHFFGDFLTAERDATRESATKASKNLKTLDIPKDYAAWKEHHCNLESLKLGSIKRVVCLPLRLEERDGAPCPAIGFFS